MHEFKDYHIISLNIGGKMYKLWVADSEDKQKKGLSKIDNLPDNSGMIFIYQKPTTHKFSMRNTGIPLTLLFLDEKGKTIHQEKCSPHQDKLVKPDKPYRYVIEI
jgi:uncharacterized membrane protein (UPF0127 family)